MAISTTKKDLQASERFQLIKITPARYVVDDLASIGGGQYSVTFPFDHVSKVERNGASLSLVTSLTGNDQYTFDESTNIVIIQAAAVPSATNVVVIYYDLFYTGGNFRYITDDPESVESAGNPLREWQAKIQRYPSISQTIRNISQGIVTISGTSITIIDDDFYSRLSLNDSFNNKDISIWQCIDSVDNIQQVFTGNIKSISINGSAVTLTVFDPFSKFNSDAFMGDQDYEAICQRTVLSFPDLFPDDSGKPLKYYASDSRHTIYYDTFVTYPITYLRNAIEGICINAAVESTPSVSNNREYVIGRVGENGLKDFNFGSTTRYISPAAGVYYYFLSDDNLVGLDNISYLTSTYWVVYRGVTFVHSGLNYNCIIARETGANNLPVNLASVTVHEKPPTLWIENSDGTVTILYYSEMYTNSYDTTSSGNKIVKFTLNSGASSPETLYSIDPIDPKAIKIKCFIQPADTFTHGVFVKKLCDSVGITTNAASFTAADLALSANIAMSIPLESQNSYSSVMFYIEHILKSTLGYLKINNSLEAEYTLLDTPASGAVVDNDLMISGSKSNQIDYNDVYNTVLTSNPHIQKIYGDEDSERATNAKARYLHGVNRTYEFEHCLADISSRIDDILTIRSSRKRTYNFDVATSLIDATVGDDVAYTDDETVNMKITDIKKDGSKISIEADDLGDL